MSWYTVGYALACVIVPVAWGLIVVAASNRIDARLVGRGKRRRPPRPIEYHI